MVSCISNNHYWIVRPEKITVDLEKSVTNAINYDFSLMRRRNYITNQMILTYE